MIRARIDGSATVRVNLRNLPTRAKSYAIVGLKRGMKLLFDRSREVIGADDHTLADLRKMGHPYSAEHGFAIHVPDETVHVQSGYFAANGAAIGGYQAGLKVDPPVAGPNGVSTQLYNENPLDRWIQEGTTKMRARPWIKYIARKYGDQAVTIVSEAIAQGLEESKNDRGGAIGAAIPRRVPIG